MNIFPKQLKTILVLSWYSLRAILRSPTSVVFSLLFPVIFILVFGAMVSDQPPALKLAVAPDCDTTNTMFRAIESIPSVSLEKKLTTAEQADALKKGRIVAILKIIPNKNPSPIPHYIIQLKATGAASASFDLLQMFIHEAIRKINQNHFPGNPSVAALSVVHVPGRTYRSIDFILPGQLGFSLLMSGIFGSSFLLFNLRQGLVLKRLRIAPVRRRSIIASEMLSRLFFHIIGFIIMVALGYFAFQFTLVNGLATFSEMLLFSLLGSFIFFGIGFIISGVLQNESSVSPVANTIVLPQILLCRLFFPVESYPHWLQKFCNILPLTLLVDGLRKIAFEGTHIWEMPVKVAGLLLWTAIISILAVKTFKWE